MILFSDFYKEKRVLITGHTGFKGSWLASILAECGAKIGGFSLPVSEENYMYTLTKGNKLYDCECFGDINNYEGISDFFDFFDPDIVFHLAAQPLVRRSYKDPYYTFSTNVMGTVNIMEAWRKSKKNPVIVNVTTDKCYENNEWIWGYRENEKLGGDDPYSASKACAEIITNAFLCSFSNSQRLARLATARAGNVIGGGDVASDRLVPDFFRAFDRGEALLIRNPNSNRPWQHVIEPLFGYLKLAEKIYNDPKKYVGAWNFGPSIKSESVGKIVKLLSEMLGYSNIIIDDTTNVHEAQNLKLDSSKAYSLLNWQPKLSVKESLQLTCDWYLAEKRNLDMQKFTMAQIDHYFSTFE